MKCEKCGHEATETTETTLPTAESIEQIFKFADAAEQIAEPMGINRVAAAMIMFRMGAALANVKTIGDVQKIVGPERPQ